MKSLLTRLAICIACVSPAMAQSSGFDLPLQGIAGTISAAATPTSSSALSNLLPQVVTQAVSQVLQAQAQNYLSLPSGLPATATSGLILNVNTAPCRENGYTDPTLQGGSGSQTGVSPQSILANPLATLTQQAIFGATGQILNAVGMPTSNVAANTAAANTAAFNNMNTLTAPPVQQQGGVQAADTMMQMTQPNNQ